MANQTEVVIIGAGQAGLTLSYVLKERGIEHVVLDRADHVGSSWRNRWDSMTMITPNWMNGLPGLPYPGEPDGFSTRADTVRYLEEYVSAIEPPLELGVAVNKVEPAGDGFAVDTSQGQRRAHQVVVAVGPFQAPKIPAFASALAPEVTQLHSGDYRRPSQIPAGATVLVVGSGNSGSQIAADLSATHSVTQAVGSNPQFPRRLSGAAFVPICTRLGGADPQLTEDEASREADFMWWMKRADVWNDPVGTPFANRVGAKDGDPYFGPPLAQAAPARGITLAGRVTGAEGNKVLFEDGSSLAPDAVVWATGWRRAFDWVAAPVFDDDGKPRHQRGITEVPGLYFLGLRFLHSLSSALLLGAGRDASHLAEAIGARAGQS